MTQHFSSAEAYAYHNGPRSGTIFVFDLRGVGFRHLFQPGISSIRKGIRFMEDGSPFDIKAIHILNTVPFFDMIIGELDMQGYAGDFKMIISLIYSKAL